MLILILFVIIAFGAILTLINSTSTQSSNKPTTAAVTESAGIISPGTTVAGKTTAGTTTAGTKTSKITTAGTTTATGKTNAITTQVATTKKLEKFIMMFGDNMNNKVSGSVGLTNIKDIAIGANHVIGLKEDGTIIAWGDNTFYQTEIPPELLDPKTSNVISIDAGENHSLVLKKNGTVVSWSLGQQANVRDELKDPSTANVIAIAAGGFHSLALRSDNTIVVWGENYFNQLNFTFPNNNIIAIAAGHMHSVVLKKDGTVFAFGNNDHRQLSISVTDVISISAGDYYSFALKRDGSISVWGEPSSDANYNQTRIPSNLNYPSQVKSVYAGGTASLALKEDGTAVSWGMEYVSNYLNGLTNIVSIKVKYNTYAIILNEQPPIRTMSPAKQLLINQYIDRGCWIDGGIGDVVSKNHLNRAVANTYIYLDRYAGPDRSKWLEYAANKAINEGFDTFAIQSSVLFLGNYGMVLNGKTYKYDLYGRELGTCNEFGDAWINRVYSKVAPS
jgi:hypothetical protein